MNRPKPARASLVTTGLLLVALLFGVAGCRKGDSKRAGAQMRAVSNAIEQYARLHTGRLPTFNDLDHLQSLLLPYLIPDGEQKPSFDGIELTLPLLARPETGEPYVFNAGVSAAFDSETQKRDQIIVFYESKENYGGRLVAYLDGHHVWVPHEQWEQMCKTGPFPLAAK